MKTHNLKNFVVCRFAIGFLTSAFCALIFSAAFSSSARAQQNHVTTQTADTVSRTITETVSYNSTEPAPPKEVVEPYVENSYEDKFSKPSRKGCIEDFRQCARKTIDDKDDGRGSNESACERWKNECKIHHPAIFKTIDETTDWRVISYEDFELFQQLKEANKIRTTVEKVGNKTITTKRELDDDGNEKVTTTVEEVKEIYELLNKQIPQTAPVLPASASAMQEDAADDGNSGDENAENSDNDNESYDDTDYSEDNDISIIAG